MEEKNPGFIRRTFSRLMSFISWLRLVIVNLLFVFILVIVVTMLSVNKLPTVPEKGALLLDIEGRLVDQLSYSDPFELLIGGVSAQRRETLLQDVVDAIDYARDDKRITTLVLQLDNMTYAGISKMQEIASALERFRMRGKNIIAIGDSYSQDQYWLAAQADEVYVHPFGGVTLEGYGIYRNYYKSALDKLKIDVHVFRVGEFKSAMEPFMRDDMSQAARNSNLVWLESLWSEYVGGVVERRELERESIEYYVEKYDKLLASHDGSSAVTALKQGLVDGIKNRSEIAAHLEQKIGANKNNSGYAKVGFRQYLWLKKIELPKLKSGNNVGVITAAGNIINGKQPAGMIGADSLAELIVQARQDSHIKSVVLRVDSGGGSLFASEIIRNELELLQRTGKPLVVSMGSMAASGGYWIAALADEIWATPTTLTGSIGVFGVFPTIEQSLKHVGIATDGVGTHTASGAVRVDRRLPEAASRTIQTSIEYGYKRFIDIVATGRNMEISKVEAIAGGRVWTGIDAYKIGLVDKLGGMDQAIASAAAMADLDYYNVKRIEQPKTPQQQLIEELMGSVSALGLLDNNTANSQVLTQLQRFVAPFLDSMAFLSTMNDPQGVYLHCTACIAP